MSNENINKPFKLYSNDIQLSVGYFDFTLHFKHNTPDAEDLLGSITLSPQHAKSLAQLILQNVQHYESIFGNIPYQSPEDMQQLVEKGIIKAGPQ